MNIKAQRGVLFCILMLAALPAFAQSARIVWQGVAYAYAEDRLITEQMIDQVIGTPVEHGAQVIFFRPVNTGFNEARLMEADELLAQLPGGAYYAMAVSPGTHTYIVDGSPIQLHLPPGKRGYIRISNRHATHTPLPSNAMTFLRVTTGKRPPLFLY